MLSSLESGPGVRPSGSLAQGEEQMRDMVPPHYLELIANAALKSYWRKAPLRTLLRRCGVSENFLSTWAADESKRDFLNRLFPRLESQGDAGVRLFNRLADSLVQQTTFPDLEGWEDSEKKKADAKGAIESLRAYREAQRTQAAREREKKAVRERAEAIQAGIRQNIRDLQKLQDRLEALSARLGEQKAGYEFQDWFYDLADYFEVLNRRPYVSGGRQIDGSVTVDGTTYLVELKFTKEQSGSGAVDSLYKKVGSKADNTMGIMVSISGYSTVAKSEASGPKSTLLLLDHNHIYWALRGGARLDEIISRSRRHSSQTGEAYLPCSAFVS